MRGRSHFIGCLLGGAVGDALGWPIEFDDIADIRARHGEAGIVHPEPNDLCVFEITDDTQMTLFTAEGLLRAMSGEAHTDKKRLVRGVWYSYLCWLKTQGGYRAGLDLSALNPGWLLTISGLHRKRAPAVTCLSALSGGLPLNTGVADNCSKGCGGVMRAAPAGLLAARYLEPHQATKLAFELGCATAALTHGDPGGYHPAGALAVIVACLVENPSIEEAAEYCLQLLDRCLNTEETAASVRRALDLWRKKDLIPGYQAVESLGGGWIGSEALSIALYCALAAEGDFAKGVRLAVNHSGDSDSTGSIAGNILGVALGEEAIPAGWTMRLELAETIREVAIDLFSGCSSSTSWQRKYPPLPDETLSFLGETPRTWTLT